MGKSANIRNHVGVPVEILGQKYNMLLTMLGNDYLEEIYGNPIIAMQKFQQMISRMKETGLDKESREILIHFIYAAICHNAYDFEGEIIRKIPTAFEIKSSLGQNALMKLLQAMNEAQNMSFPEPKESDDDQEEKDPNFTKN
jgi:hypothetical protein